jgi:hypothetical protein
MFDPNNFMSQNVDAPMATEMRLVPEGEYQAMIDSFEAEKAFNEIKWNDRNTGEERSAVQFSLPFSILDEALKAELERDRIIVYAKMFLDFDDNGALSAAPDKNVTLGRIRAAVGQNGAGPWNFSMLQGQGPVMIRVTHRADKNNPERKYVEVSRVAPVR